MSLAAVQCACVRLPGKTGVLMFAEDCCCYKASSAAAHQLTLLQMEVEAPLAQLMGSLIRQLHK